MRVECSVKVEIVDDDGLLRNKLRVIELRRGSAELRRGSGGAPPSIALFDSENERPRLVLDLAPPLSLAGKQASTAGLLGITFRRARLHPRPSAVTSTASVLLSRFLPLSDAGSCFGRYPGGSGELEGGRAAAVALRDAIVREMQRRQGAAPPPSSAAAAAAAAAAASLHPRSSMMTTPAATRTPEGRARQQRGRQPFFFSRKFYSPEAVADEEAAAARREKRLRLHEARARKEAAERAAAAAADAASADDDEGEETETRFGSSLFSSLSSLSSSRPLAPPAPADPGPRLTPEQSRALDAILSGESVFLSGEAGSGKSVVLRAAIRRLPPSTTFVTAPTGLAAAALGGVTLHAFAGFGHGASRAIEGGAADGASACSFAGVAAAVRSALRPRNAKRWRSCRVLVVDEVSMVSAAMFEALEAAARAARRSERPFGGIQLVLCGDWLQLPPVVGSSSSPSPKRFAFQASCWASCVPRETVLTEVHRQKGSVDGGDDGERRRFVALLGRLRVGAATAREVEDLCLECSVPFEARTGATPGKVGEGVAVLPTRLLTHRADVDAVNSRQLSELEGEEVVYEAVDEGDEAFLDGGGSSSGAGSWARRRLSLKVGCQVLLTRNVDASIGLVNGARGVVVGFGRPVSSSSSSFRPPVVRWASSSGSDDEDDETNQTEVFRVRVAAVSGGRVVAARTQLPLDLAFALSVHKCQGMTLRGKTEVSLSKGFDSGMCYVALSRVRRLRDLRIVGDVAPAALAADPDAKAFYERLERAGGDFVRGEDDEVASAPVAASESCASEGTTAGGFGDDGGDGGAWGRGLGGGGVEAARRPKRPKLALAGGGAGLAIDF